MCTFPSFFCLDFYTPFLFSLSYSFTLFGFYIPFLLPILYLFGVLYSYILHLECSIPFMIVLFNSFRYWNFDWFLSVLVYIIFILCTMYIFFSNMYFLSDTVLLLFLLLFLFLWIQPSFEFFQTFLFQLNQINYKMYFFEQSLTGLYFHLL